MRKKFVQIVALCLALVCAVMCVSASSGTIPGGYFIPETDPPVPSMGQRSVNVGISYGNGALDGANLSNATGSGYSFGYYDSGAAFVQLAQTQHSDISVAKTENVYYGTYEKYTSYHDCIVSDVAVGCYHLQLSGTYYSYWDAQNVASMYTGGFVAYINGAYYVRIGNYTQRAYAESAMYALPVASEIVGTSSYGLNVIITGTNTIIFQYDDLGNGTGLGVEPVSVDGSKCQTWFKGYRWFGGFQYNRVGGGDMTVSNRVDIEDYANCVISREMSNAWPLEALKAQAVAARSYAVSLNRHSAFDLCNTTCCQAYYGTALIGANTAQAVAETSGQYIWYNGNVARAFYSSSNGGASEDVSVVWGSNQDYYPYLVGVIDPYEAMVSIPKYTYSKEISPYDLALKLQEKGHNCSTIVNAYVSEYTDTGNPKKVTFVDSAGRTFVLDSRVVRSMLSLRSYRYDFGDGSRSQFSVNGTDIVNGLSGLYATDGYGNLIPVSEGAFVITSSGVSQTSTGSGSIFTSSGNILITGAGDGHNVGMSQWGACSMAQQGFTYDQILKFYYTGVTVG